MYGRMPLAPRDEVLAAIDCVRCRALVTAYAPDPVVVHALRCIDVGSSAAYEIAAHYGRDVVSNRIDCPDCGRKLSVQQYQNDYFTLMPLDRDVVGR